MQNITFSILFCYNIVLYPHVNNIVFLKGGEKVCKHCINYRRINAALKFLKNFDITLEIFLLSFMLVKKRIKNCEPQYSPCNVNFLFINIFYQNFKVLVIYCCLT